MLYLKILSICRFAFMFNLDCSNARTANEIKSLVIYIAPSYGSLSLSLQLVDEFKFSHRQVSELAGQSNVTEFQVLLQDKLCKTAPPRSIRRVTLRPPHFPLILSIVPFWCETTDSRAVAYYSPVSRLFSFDLASRGRFSF